LTVGPSPTVAPWAIVRSAMVTVLPAPVIRKTRLALLPLT
jgi:hypothetical protein